MTAPLCPYAQYTLVQDRLLEIFPEGFAFRGYCTRDIAASTVFSLLYIGAVENTGRFAAPKQVYRMSDEQEELTSDAERISYAHESTRSGFVPRGQPWYADNSRESIRDETLRQGFLPVGAAVEDKSVPTTSGKPRYALAADFAALFDPRLSKKKLLAAIEAWRNEHLSPAALARIRLVRAGAAKPSSTSVPVSFPNGETRNLSPGPSSIISKAVIEEFAVRFLTQPAVIWLSESGNKVVARDDILARSINLSIDAAKSLPDIILVDLGHGRAEEVLLVFVEVVATDGPVSVARKDELLEISRAAHFDDSRVAFVTAYLDRNEPALRKTFSTLAWNTFMWLASEPDNIIALFGVSSLLLQTLMKSTGTQKPALRTIHGGNANAHKPGAKKPGRH